MTHFEYVMTLASFVIAFGVARLLGGWARQYALRKQAPPYFLQVAVSVVLLVALLQNAWAFWFARAITWTFGTFLLMLTSQLALVGAATLIHCPDSYTSGIRDYYYEVRKAVFGLCAVWVVAGGILDYIYSNSLSGDLPLGVMFAFRTMGLVLFLFMAWSDRAAHHWAALGSLVILQAGWIVVVSNDVAAYCCRILAERASWTAKLTSGRY